MIRPCNQCGAPYKTKPWLVAKGRAIFCSLACYGLDSRGKPKPKPADFGAGVSERMKAFFATPEGHASAVKSGSGNKGVPKMGNRDENHWQWKGDDVGYASLHRWVKRRLGTARTYNCALCGDRQARDWANISREYKRDLTDWAALCRECHQKYDNVSERAWITRKGIKNA